jgi:hypothetical protein
LEVNLKVGTTSKIGISKVEEDVRKPITSPALSRGNSVVLANLMREYPFFGIGDSEMLSGIIA